MVISTALKADINSSDSIKNVALHRAVEQKYEELAKFPVV